MIIEDKLFGRSWRVRISERSYIVERRHKNKNGGHGWKPFGHHVTLAGAVKSIIRQRNTMPRTTVTLAEYVERFEKAFNDVKETLSI